MSQKDRPKIMASLDREAHKYKVIGISPSSKKIHLKKGAVLMAKQMRTTEKSRLKILPAYKSVKGEALNCLAINTPRACGR